ncbi:MAG: hypothetical protein U0V75_01730 [Ferruginibacter sp.]
MNKLFFVIALYSSIFIVSCSKNSGSSTPAANTDSLVALYVGGTLSRLITIDENTTNQRFLEMSTGGGPVYRHLIDKSYPYSYIESTFDSRWKVESASNAVFPAGTGPATLDNEIVMIHSKKNPSYWLWVVKGGTVSGFEEWYLWSNYVNAARPSTDQYKFKLHQVADRNGVHAYTIESVQKPGWYLHNAGHTITANGVLLYDHNTGSAQKTIFEFH